MFALFNKIKILLFLILVYTIAFFNINALIKNDGTKISYIDNKTIPTFSLPENKEELFTGEYFNNLSNVLTENFVRRNEFIEEYFIFNRLIGKNYMNNILIDKDENLQYYFSPLTEEEYTNIYNGLNDINDYFKTVNTDYYMFKIPSKNEFYKDLYYDYTIENENIYIKEISNYITQNLDFKYYNLNQYFNSLEDAPQLYYKTDHHWNNIGSYLGYSYIYSILSNNYSIGNKVSVIGTEGVDNVFSGSRARQIGYGYRNNQIKDDFYYNLTNDTNKYTMNIYGEEYSGGYEIFYFTDILNDIDKYENLYGVFMGGDYPLVTISNDTVDNDYTTLIIKDSYTNAILPYLASHFKNTIVVDLRYSDEPISYYVNEYNPDITLQIISNFKVMDMYNVY